MKISYKTKMWLSSDAQLLLLGLGEVHLWMSCLELLQEIVLLLLQHQAHIIRHRNELIIDRVQIGETKHI